MTRTPTRTTTKASRLFKIGASIVAGGAVALATAACGDGKLDGGSDRSVYVRQALGRESTSDSCDFRPEASWPSLREGLHDLAVRDTYNVTLLVQSSNAAATQRNTAHDRVLEPSGTVISEYTATVSSFVDGGGLGLADVPGIDPPTRQRLMDKIAGVQGATAVVTVEVTLSGKTITDLPVSTPTFVLPVRACSGCLVSFETGNDPATAGLNCNLPLPPTVRRPCRPGQDEVTPCQMCLNRVECNTPTNR